LCENQPFFEVQFCNAFKIEICQAIPVFFKGFVLTWSDDIPSADSFKVQDVPLLSKHAPQNAFKVLQLCCFTVMPLLTKEYQSIFSACSLLDLCYLFSNKTKKII